MVIEIKGYRGYKGYGGYRGEMGLKKAGYEKLIVWQNAKLLRKMSYDITTRFSSVEMRRVSQMRDAARSVKQNIQEGYSKKSRRDYLRFLDIAKGSLSELRGDIEDCHEDNLITQKEFEKINEIICKTDYLFKKLITSLAQKITPITPITPVPPITPKRERVL